MQQKYGLTERDETTELALLVQGRTALILLAMRH
jgi:hypothetical protein